MKEESRDNLSKSDNYHTHNRGLRENRAEISDLNSKHRYDRDRELKRHRSRTRSTSPSRTNMRKGSRFKDDRRHR